MLVVFFLGYGAVKGGGALEMLQVKVEMSKIFLRLMKKSYGSGTNILNSVFRWFVLGSKYSASTILIDFTKVD